MIGSVLVTGANRGLGLGLVRALAPNGLPTSANRVIATCRNPDRSQELKELSEKYSNIHIIQLDVTDLNSYARIVKDVSDITQGSGLNLLINNAGMTSKFTTLNYVKSQQLIDNFTVNTLAPIMLTKSLLPLLKSASEKNSSMEMGIKKAAVVNMSSYLGSMGMNDKGGFYPYRCSKAALNAATKSMSVDLKKDKILAVCMHPGWVKTDMGGAHAPLSVDESISGMLNTLLGFSERDSGKFYQYDGEELPW